MASRHGILLGDRPGEKFYCFDGVVLDADENAARHILARHRDDELYRYLPYQPVKIILGRRTERVKERLALRVSCRDHPGSSEGQHKASLDA